MCVKMDDVEKLPSAHWIRWYENFQQCGYLVPYCDESLLKNV